MMLTKWYLHAAFEVFFNGSFRYVRELTGENDAMLKALHAGQAQQ